MLAKKSIGTPRTKAKILTKKVQFEIIVPEAQEVYLAGDFNNWDTSTKPMKKDKKGIWFIFSVHRLVHKIHSEY